MSDTANPEKPVAKAAASASSLAAKPAPEKKPTNKAASPSGDAKSKTTSSSGDTKPAAAKKTVPPKKTVTRPKSTKATAPLPPVASPVEKAQLARRHVGLGVAFFVCVLLPVAISGWYLFNRAADQYASYVGFSVRSESGSSPADLVSGLGSIVGASTNSTSDTDILYKFIQSHDLVERVNTRMDLRHIWSKAPDDPVFGYRGHGSLEDLVLEWNRKIRIYYDSGMIDLRVLAFDPHDAQQIAQAILEESGLLVNQLNDVAREDTLRYSRDELERAQERLRQARQEITQFRNQYQLVDPTADVQGQVGVVSSLQQQLAEQLVSLGMLQANVQARDPRIDQTKLRIDIIREQIEAERQKFGSDTQDGQTLSELVGKYEILAVDREFAERSYTAALAAHDSARAEAARQSRYVAPYVRPTLAQTPEFPERSRLLFIIAGFLIVMWVIGVLVYYSLRDRR
ncbi:hypothetical protein [Paracoccus sp. (in: a-proteobacteria)]|uniref:hypothetical protein n=1 Tax=Paracoccus sp. TaxID=267 RepID=UPI0026E0D54E|nr:hypothetical protein [Paracoccus sp. (in: a-proteobacteria)]MDO5646873.1 hypothetical protein [Paracoccus sp. (in: a-proteobacteria)]